ncbi:phytanoyl-CoA dioxygenase family protein [Streptomyces sp. WZ-12]|uniref:phytanoyl-CoA dioxygenase family protein n=1 Tax=Streptomyces sp. WZ-12 TaxID=3030210 RepID=UPI00238109DE|nr:phytanoyl-CoA dioxygenase family protein [Streptomyces sp. WZ-12]
MNTLDLHAEEFRQQGFTVFRSVLPPDQVKLMRNLAEGRYRACVADPPDRDTLRGGVSLMRAFEFGTAFRDVLALEPVIQVVEALLGDDCHVISQNVLRTPTGRGIVNWHIDDALFFPFFADLNIDPKHVPVYSLNVMIALSDVPTDAFGPTQVAPGSHLSGRRPERSPDLPAGWEPVSLRAQTGDCYLVNSQTWHRGAQNETGRTRYVLTTAYGRRFISQRFYPFINYTMPPHVLSGAGSRIERLLGAHDKGPYG